MKKGPIFSIDFLILWLALGQLITDTIIQTHFKQLCWGFAGDLQLPIKFWIKQDTQYTEQ